MMKMIYATLVATVLALATMGQGYAFGEADAGAVQALMNDSNTDDLGQVMTYATQKGYEVVLYDDAAKIEKLDKGMTVFAQLPFPTVPGYVLVSKVPDPTDGTNAVFLFTPDGKIIGVGWAPDAIIDTVLDYVEAGI